MPGPYRLWDAPVRLFHGAFAALVVFSWVTGKVGGSWMEWHLRSGYAIVALVLFRISWGLVGSDTARFSRFVRAPGTALRYLREAAAGRHQPWAGHNPLGGWMVVLMLVLVGAQAFSGLFADDEISTQGPLSVKVSSAFVSRMNQLHGWNEWVIAGAVVLHVAAIAFYRLRWGADLVRPMIDGRTDLPEAAGLRFRSPLLAAVLLAIAASFVYWLVIVFPRPVA